MRVFRHIRMIKPYITLLWACSTFLSCGGPTAWNQLSSAERLEFAKNLVSEIRASSQNRIITHEATPYRKVRFAAEDISAERIADTPFGDCKLDDISTCIKAHFEESNLQAAAEACHPISQCSEEFADKVASPDDAQILKNPSCPRAAKVCDFNWCRREEGSVNFNPHCPPGLAPLWDEQGKGPDNIYMDSVYGNYCGGAWSCGRKIKVKCTDQQIEENPPFDALDHLCASHDTLYLQVREAWGLLPKSDSDDQDNWMFKNTRALCAGEVTAPPIKWPELKWGNTRKKKEVCWCDPNNCDPGSCNPQAKSGCAEKRELNCAEAMCNYDTWLSACSIKATPPQAYCDGEQTKKRKLPPVKCETWEKWTGVCLAFHVVHWITEEVVDVFGNKPECVNFHHAQNLIHSGMLLADWKFGTCKDGCLQGEPCAADCTAVDAGLCALTGFVESLF